MREPEASHQYAGRLPSSKAAIASGAIATVGRCPGFKELLRDSEYRLTVGSCEAD